MHRFALFFVQACFWLSQPPVNKQKPDSAAAQNTPSTSPFWGRLRGTQPGQLESGVPARAGRRWGIDCEMCDNQNGEARWRGQGYEIDDGRLHGPGFPKDSTDGEIYWIIKDGHSNMPAEGTRITTKQG